MTEEASTQNVLSEKASNISPSPTLAVDAKAKALKAAGEDVCGFGAGEPDFDTPSFIKEACIKALEDGHTKYAPAAGIPALREALAQKYESEYGIASVKSEQIIVSPGGKYSCYLSFLATCNPGDRVLIPAPYWVSYPEMVKLVGAEPVILPTTQSNEFKITPAQIEEACDARTRMILLNSPSNPTGVVYTRKELEAIVETCMRHQLLILSDEIYEHLLYDDAQHTCLASLSPEVAARTITASGFSKTYSMTGWRLGTLMAPPALSKAIASIQSQTTSNATSFAQWGALAALQQPQNAKEAISQMLEVFDRRRLQLLKGLNAIPGMECIRSQGAFYLFPNIESYGLSAQDFAKKLLEDQKVAVVPGDGFGVEGHLRVSYAVSDRVIENGLQRLQEFCRNRS